MKLEQEIHQVKFRNEFHKLAVNIIYTHGWLMNRQNELFCRYGITGSQYNILRILRGQHPKPATIGLLKDRMLDKMSDASRLVERLRIKGLIKRETSEDDRRRVDVSITQQGLELLKKMDELDEYYDSIFKMITPEEALLLNDLLDKLRWQEPANSNL